MWRPGSSRRQGTRSLGVTSAQGNRSLLVAQCFTKTKVTYHGVTGPTTHDVVSTPLPMLVLESATAAPVR